MVFESLTEMLFYHDNTPAHISALATTQLSYKLLPYRILNGFVGLLSVLPGRNKSHM